MWRYYFSPDSLILCFIQLIASHDNRVLFVKTRDIDYVPTLRVLHQYPLMMPRQLVDKGAIRFVLSGAQIMAPG